MTEDLPPFANEPVLELRRASARAGLDEALAAVDSRLPLSVPVTIAGDTREPAGEELVSGDPGQPDRVVAVATRATAPDVASAVSAAEAGFEQWSRTPAA